MECFDFSCWTRDTKSYGGATEKRTLLAGGRRWLLKLPPGAAAEDGGVFSEYIASKLFARMGLSVQEVLLGQYEGKPAAACMDFLQPGEMLVPFCELGDARCGAEKGDRDYCFDKILCLLERYMGSEAASAKDFFWTMYVMDALLANRDRHARNWGFIRSVSGLRVAPVFDNEYCLFPETALLAGAETIAAASELRRPLSRIYYKGEESRYADVMESGVYEGCTRALGRLYQGLSTGDIDAIVTAMPLVTPNQREFYRRVLNGRLRRLRDIYACLRSGQRKRAE